MELGALGEQLFTENPARGIPKPALQFIAVLNDAARFDRRQVECFRLNPESARLEQRLLENISVEPDHGAVGPDGTGANVFHILDTFDEGNLDIGPLPPFLSENFDA